MEGAGAADYEEARVGLLEDGDCFAAAFEHCGEGGGGGGELGGQELGRD